MSVKKSTRRKKTDEASLERSLSREEVSRILGAVTYDRAFYFYNGIAKPTGEFAISLSDFCNKINAVSPECLAFHVKRRDFQKWISEVIGDVELGKRMDKIPFKDSALKSTVHAFVSNRIKELQDSWPILLAMH